MRVKTNSFSSRVGSPDLEWKARGAHPVVLLVKTANKTKTKQTKNVYSSACLRLWSCLRHKSSRLTKKLVRRLQMKAKYVLSTRVCLSERLHAHLRKTDRAQALHISLSWQRGWTHVHRRPGESRGEVKVGEDQQILPALGIHTSYTHSYISRSTDSRFLMTISD